MSSSSIAARRLSASASDAGCSCRRCSRMRAKVSATSVRAAGTYLNAGERMVVWPFGSCGCLFIPPQFQRRGSRAAHGTLRSTLHWSVRPQPVHRLGRSEIVDASARFARVIDPYPEPVEPRADPLPQHRAVLADPAVKASMSSPPSTAVSAPISRTMRRTYRSSAARALGFAACAASSGLRARRKAGDTEQPGLVIQQMRELLHGELFGLHQMQQDAGVERAAARAHHQSVERREAHRGRHALQAAASRTGWRRCRDGRRSCGRARRRHAVRQGDRHVLVRQTVKSVAPDAFLPQRVRQRQHLLRTAEVCGGTPCRSTPPAGSRGSSASSTSMASSANG